MAAGAIDVVAVKKANGTIECSPFHVKMNNINKQTKDIKSSSRIVKLKINGKQVPLSMKLGRAGEAFFLERTRVITTRGEHNSLRRKSRNINSQSTLTTEKMNTCNNTSFESIK